MTYRFNFNAPAGGKLPKDYDWPKDAEPCRECLARGRRWVACGYMRCEVCKGTGYIEVENDADKT